MIPQLIVAFIVATVHTAPITFSHCRTDADRLQDNLKVTQRVAQFEVTCTFPLKEPK